MRGLEFSLQVKGGLNNLTSSIGFLNAKNLVLLKGCEHVRNVIQ